MTDKQINVQIIQLPHKINILITITKDSEETLHSLGRSNIKTAIEKHAKLYEKVRVVIVGFTIDYGEDMWILDDLLRNDNVIEIDLRSCYLTLDAAKHMVYFFSHHREFKRWNDEKKFFVPSLMGGGYGTTMDIDEKLKQALKSAKLS
jgi:hypothetical protein